MYEWDENKRISNLEKHGVDFSDIVDFDWGNAVIIDTTRPEEQETRNKAIGFIQLRDRLYTVVYTVRGGNIRLISARRSNRTEEKIYEKATQ